MTPKTEIVSPEAFFRRDCRVLARAVVGMICRFGDVTFVVRETKAYPSNELAHKRVATMNPGEVFVSPFMGRFPLLLVACFDGTEIGASIRIDAIDIQPSGTRTSVQRVKTSGAVGAALNLGLAAEGTMTYIPTDGSLLLAITIEGRPPKSSSSSKKVTKK